jgi:UPF0755 protein
LAKFLQVATSNSKHQFSSNEELLTLASIIEREAVIDSEKSRIAAVYLNRMRIKMPLQADPTVIFAVTNGETLDLKLTYKDLKFKSPYNTYLNRGLPPSPICNPGKTAINAALNPIETKEIYFVSDNNGGHYFSSNFKEHLKNIKIYREKIKK